MLMLVIARALCGIGIGAFDSLMKIVIAGKVVYIEAWDSYDDNIQHTRSCTCALHRQIPSRLGNFLGSRIHCWRTCWYVGS